MTVTAANPAQQARNDALYARMRKTPDLLLLPGEVAALLRVDAKTVGRWCTERRLPSIATPGHHRRIRARDVLAIIDGQATL